MENTTFLGVTIDTINGPCDFKVKKALKRSASLLDIIQFVDVTKFKLNMVMFDYFWQVMIGNRRVHVHPAVLEWFGYTGEIKEQRKNFVRMLKRNKISFNELISSDEEVKQYPTIQQELVTYNEGAKACAKFLIIEPDDLKMAIMQLKTKNGDTIRQYYIDLEKLLKVYTEYTLYFNNRESQRKITDLEQMMANMDLKMQKQEEERKQDRNLIKQQTQYLKSLGITLEEVKDQNDELLDNNTTLKKEVKKVQRKLGIASDGQSPSSDVCAMAHTSVEDRAPQPEDESKRERFVLIKRNDNEYYPYYTIRAQDCYTIRKLKTEKLHFPNLEVLLDFKCNPNSKSLFTRIKENLKATGVVFKGNNIDLEDSKVTEEKLVEEMKVINDQKYNV
ncbi:hypothetical protein IIV22A_117R [Invertebrate iridescent virus 22]|uniref:MSV199 domain-containing protein n=1 Tax=Invertebrate iridescent virus 22 TaxID=345198 RepID=W8W1Z9_9VIRU|nr:hypothetical protein IIV22A_117R [Invertebrate iridescent virus 22]CCV01961.1 hypothetical protein IIV22A_117R [Invertebrate iridescent virus 22]